MSYVYDEQTIGPYRIEVWNDECPLNPMEDWDAQPTIVHWHSRYNLGEQYPESFPHPFEEREAAIEAIRAEYGCTVVVPVYLYDHSGITISTTPFSCPWDSGQVGFAFFTSKALKDGWGDHPWPTDEALPEIIASSLESYDMYLRGDVKGFTIEGPNVHESVGGFFCSEEDVMKEAEAYIDAEVLAQWEVTEQIKRDHPDMQNTVIC